VIHDIDSALRGLIEDEVLDGAAVDIDFAAPTKDWAARRNSPTIDVYLYDIRQDVTRRAFGRVERRDDGRVTERRPVPQWFRLSYLVTAWTQRPEDEHRLLSDLLACFLAHDFIPAERLEGPVTELGLSVPIGVALPPSQDRSLSDVWSALGGELKPSLDIAIIAPLLPATDYPVGPPVTHEPGLRFLARESGEEIESVDPRPVTDGARRRGRIAEVS